LDSDGFFPADDRDIGEVFVADEGRDALGLTLTRRQKGGDRDDYEAPPPGIVIQISMMFQREMKNIQRDVTAVGARFGLTTFLGLLVGIIFFDVGETDSANPGNLNSHFGALMIVMLMSMFGTAQPALLAFPAERPVFLREYSTNHYSVVSYFLSRFTVEAMLTGLQILNMVCFQYQQFRNTNGRLYS
jgi:ABC-2 type transporter